MSEPLRPQVSREMYWSREYNSKERFCSFWHQVDETLALGARSVLEIGPGSGLVTDLLRRAGLEVTTLDFDPSVGADVTGSVTELPLEDDAFDAVLCAQVLEHLPWERAIVALAEINRVARTGAVVSVPDSSPYAGTTALYFGPYADAARGRLPASRLALLRDILARRMRVRDFLFARLVPYRWGPGGGPLELRRPPIPHVPPPAEFDGQHYWEIGLDGYPLERVESALTDAGFADARSYRVPENPWHRFFVLTPGR